MKTKLLRTLLALGACSSLLRAQDSQPATDTPPPPPQAAEPAPNGPPNGAPRGFHVLPPHAKEALGLSDDQMKQIADVEADVKAKLEKILTPAQLEQLKQLRPPMRQGQGRPPGAPGNQGAPGQGRPPGAPGAQGGQGGPADGTPPPAAPQE